MKRASNPTKILAAFTLCFMLGCAPTAQPPVQVNNYRSSCGSGGSVSGAIEKVSFDQSWYWLGVPDSMTHPLPLIVLLHGDEGHPHNMKAFWEPIWAQRKNFILIAPECPRGICTDENGINTWSHGRHEGSVPQGLWLREAIRQVTLKYPVDVSRIYAAGYSGGAIFLGYQGFKMFQDVFAGIQWFCGGVNETEEQVYRSPADPDCKVPGRCLVSRKGDKSYIVTAADRIIEILENNGHYNDFLDTDCRGHCCDVHLYVEETYEWFFSLPPKCGRSGGSGCYAMEGERKP